MHTWNRCEILQLRHWNIKQKHTTRKTRQRIKRYKQTKINGNELNKKKCFFFGDQCSPSIIIETPHLAAFAICIYFTLHVFINFFFGSSLRMCLVCSQLYSYFFVIVERLNYSQNSMRMRKRNDNLWIITTGITWKLSNHALNLIEITPKSGRTWVFIL